MPKKGRTSSRWSRLLEKAVESFVVETAKSLPTILGVALRLLTAWIR